MLSFSANLSMLFTEVGFVDRFAKASQAGFRGVECQFPYAYRVDELAEQLQRNNLVQVLHNLMAIMEGDLAATIRRNLKHIAHVQVADNPGRHEPGTGTIDYPLVFAALEEAGYRHWVGCEYVPLRTTDDSLDWLTQFRTRASRLRADIRH